MGMNRGSKTPFRFAAELLVVFIGVYGAFWVEGYWQRQEDREREEAILWALTEELGNLAVNGPLVRDGMAAALEEFDREVAGGGTPLPAHYREPGAETPSMSVWQATLSSGGVNLLDPELFFDLAKLYNRVESTSERYIRYNTVTEREVLPLLSQGPDAFYDPVTGNLEPRFEVHVDQLRTLWDEVSFIVARADTLRTRIRASLEDNR
jgi:hypothetical protein